MNKKAVDSSDIYLDWEEVLVGKIFKKESQLIGSDVVTLQLQIRHIFQNLLSV